MIDLQERLTEIKKERAVSAAWSTLATIGTAEIMFASFAFGASFGPGPLRPIELALGLLLSFGLGAVTSLPMARRRIERDARLIVEMHEGRKKRRIVVYRDYFTIDSELVLNHLVAQTEIDRSVLVLRYRDPGYEGAVLRELSADRAVLERFVTAITSIDRGGPAPAALRA